MTSNNKPLLITAIEDSARRKLLQSRGVPAQDMPTRRGQFYVNEAIIPMELEIPGTPIRNISVQKQLKAVESLFSNPVGTPFAIGISSFPSDLRAKAMAIAIMNRAIDVLKEQRRSRVLPVWHRVFGGARDALRDAQNPEMPSLLIISNVNDQSSGTKLEKVRDLLEMYSEVPRIVVSAGETPSELFAGKLRYPMKAGIYLGPPNRVREI